MADNSDHLDWNMPWQGEAYDNQLQRNADTIPIFPSQLLPPREQDLPHHMLPQARAIPFQRSWTQPYPVQPLNQQPRDPFKDIPPQIHVFPSQLLPTQKPQAQMPEYDETTHVLEQHGMPVARPQSTASDPEAGQYGVTGTSIVAPGSVADTNGRTYQGYREGKYFLPNDPTEQDRLDFQHAGTHIIMNDLLAWAPIQSPKWVLDIATGTGIWASDFAEEHPESNVVGSDLTPIQPPTRVSNLSFVTEDAEEPWVHDHKFDYIHARYVYTCFDNPRAVIRSAFECLNPGGWLEFQDASPLLQSGKGPAAVADSPLKKMIDLAVHGAALQGRDILVAQHYKRWLEEAGFVDVREQKVGLPINEWHPNKKLKQAGLYHSRMMLDNLRGVVWKMVQGNGLSDLEIDEMVAQVKPEYRNLDIQGYFNL
ncbi:hypothetical protein SCAR479_04187 [Seiridium cardinale]|uniref:S-adenosyl-L-methionine-dependent methyltransferase n=1 Tax=Seiridium cardinale TaxID=138064 RepID=A0ABR2XYR6_9PEZI